MFVGNNRALSYLGSVIKNRSFAHAYLFAGPDGVGKRTAAVLFARGLLCEKADPIFGGCKECVMCDLGDLEISDRFRLLELRAAPTGGSEKSPSEISIDEVRNLRSWVARASMATRVVLINEAEALSLPASNAILKILEEPHSSVVFILVSSAPEILLPTIRSRAVSIRFELVAESDLKLMQGVIAELISLARGRPGVMSRLIQDEKFRKNQQELFQLAARVYRGGSGAALSASKEVADDDDAREVLCEHLMRLFQNEARGASLADLARYRKRLGDILEALRRAATTNVNRRLFTDYLLLKLQSPKVSGIV